MKKSGGALDLRLNRNNAYFALHCTMDGQAHHNDPEGGCQERAGVSCDKRLSKEGNEMDGGLQ